LPLAFCRNVCRLLQVPITLFLEHLPIISYYIYICFRKPSLLPQVANMFFFECLSLILSCVYIALSMVTNYSTLALYFYYSAFQFLQVGFRFFLDGYRLWRVNPIFFRMPADNCRLGLDFSQNACRLLQVELSFFSTSTDYSG
jgi:hypothetical protein